MARLHNRVVVLAAAALTGCFAGSIYMWSIFNEPLMSAYGWPLPAVSFAYSLFIIIDCAGCLLGGVLLGRYESSRLLLLAGLLFSAGWFLTGFARTIPQLYLFLCVIGGFGDGLLYNVAISAATKWFPDKRGFANGVCIGCIGLSPLLFANGGNFLIQTFGLENAFHVFGLFALCVFLIFSRFVSSPPQGWQPESVLANSLDASGESKSGVQKTSCEVCESESTPDKTPDNKETPCAQCAQELASCNDETQTQAQAQVRDIPSRQMVRMPLFWMLMTCFAVMCSAGMMITAHASDIGQLLVDMDATQGALMVGLLAVGSFSGRFLFGLLSDRLGGINTFMIAMVLTACDMLFIGQANTFLLFIVALMMAGACFGACMSVMPSVCAALFGDKHFSQNYSLVYLGYTLACFVGPMLGALVMSNTGTYDLAFLISAALAVVALVMLVAIKRMAGHLRANN